MEGKSTGRTLNENEKRRFDYRSWMIIYLSLALFTLLSLTRTSFLSFNNIHSILYGASFMFFAAIGFTLLIIMGELDLSVGSMFGFGGAMMGLFVFSYRMPVGAAIPLAMLVAGLIGFVAGLLIVNFRLNSMMVTIGVMMAVKGVNWILVNKFSGRQLPVSARKFVTVDVFGIKWSIILMILTALVLEVFLYKSKHLKQLYYIGNNADTAVMYGLNAKLIKSACFAVSAMLSAFGGALMTARIAHPDVTVGSNLEVSIITAAVISGASIYGGRGSVLRTMFGVFFMFMLQNGMTSYKINSYVQQIVLGAILCFAIYLDLKFNAEKA